MRLSVHHRTSYAYDGKVSYSAQYLHLTPVSNPSQRVVRWRIDALGQLTEWHDAFGNVCHTNHHKYSPLPVCTNAPGE